MQVKFIIYFMFIMLAFIRGEILPLSQRYFHQQEMGYEYSRGTYLIVLADASLKNILVEESTGNFIDFKQKQGYNVKVIDLEWTGGTATDLQYFLKDYYLNIDPLLEYVLLIGDVNGSFSIPSFTIPSYNEDDQDVTDYPYTFLSNEDMLKPVFFLGRWSIRSHEDLRKIKLRTIQYSKMDYISDVSYLNKALVVAGNYKDDPDPETWPVTPVMTSKWLMDKLYYHGYSVIDTVFFTKNNITVDKIPITSSWNEGVGVVNYRGWGDAKGWKKPQFQIDDINDNDFNNEWRFPVVLSFVCNTGDFGNQIPYCFGESLITGGTLNKPKGAVAVVGPSDLDTDTRFNNVMCAVMWDEILELRIPELAPALHAGKYALVKEFPRERCGNYYSCAEFYAHVYGVLGDPSISVWTGEPKNMFSDIEPNLVLSSSFISTVITDSLSGLPLMDVVGALMYDDILIAKGLSNSLGQIVIEFSNDYNGKDLVLYLNKDQYYQKSISVSVNLIDEIDPPENTYSIPPQDSQYIYEFENIDYNWVEINHKGNNLNLTDDSIVDIDIGFDFIYYGKTFSKLTICSNGWVSFLPCLKDESKQNNCNPLAYFNNESITNPLGPYAMIAPFFDDLDDDTQNEAMNIYYYLTNNSDSLIVQWDNVPNNRTNKNCPNADCERETFQLILDNNNKSQSGNGEIIFQYKEIYDIDENGATVGIESPDKNSGTEYVFSYNYNQNAIELNNSLAIRFAQKCDSPVRIDACDCNGNILDCAGVCGGTAIIDSCGVCNGDNSTCIKGCTYSGASNFDSNATLNDGSCIISGCTNLYSENYNASATIDDGSCILSLYNGLIPHNVLLNSYPNPFNPIVTFSYSLSEMDNVSLKVYNIFGQELEVLTNQYYHPGYYSLRWDASAQASGLYLVTLITGGSRLTQKISLLK